MLKQMGRLEAQRTRIAEYISENKIDDVKYEKLLLDIDTKINTLFLRTSSDQHTEIEIKKEKSKTSFYF